MTHIHVMKIDTEAEQTHRDNLADAVRHSPKPAGSTIEKVRWVKANHQCARIGGVLVDDATANAICAVYDALDDVNKAKLAALPIRQMAAVAWKLVK